MISQISVVKTGEFKHRLRGLPPRLNKKTTDFLELIEARNFSPHTVRAYAYDLAVFFRWHKHRRLIFKDLQAKHLAEFIKAQAAMSFKPTSINRRLNTVEVFYRFCFNSPVPGKATLAQGRRPKFLTYDSRFGIHKIHKRSFKNLRAKVTKPMIVPLEYEEVTKFLSEIKTPRDKSIVLLMLMCGLRSMEVIGLKSCDIDRTNMTIRIWGKGQKERVVPAPTSLLNIIDRYIILERPHGIDTEHLFVSLKGRSRGNPMTREGFRGLFRYKRKKSGITNANPHRFRHTFGRDMAAAGMSLQALMEIFGHSTPEMVQNYVRLILRDIFPEYKKAVANLLHHYA